jgi:hypothetical protein
MSAADCVEQLNRILRNEGFNKKESFEKKRKIMIEEVTSAQYKNLEVEKLEQSINEQFEKWEADKTNQEVTNHLMALYNKAIEYWGAQGNLERSQMYL